MGITRFIRDHSADHTISNIMDYNGLPRTTRLLWIIMIIMIIKIINAKMIIKTARLLGLFGPLRTTRPGVLLGLLALFRQVGISRDDGILAWLHPSAGFQ